MNLQTLIQQIDERKKDLDVLRSISPEREAKIKQIFRLWWNYHSNAIEGNQLTLGETVSLILYDLTAKGKSYKDHREVKGHNEALLWIEEIVEENRPITQNFIRELHQMLLKEPYDSPAITPMGQTVQKKIKVGEYKTTPNHVRTPTGEIYHYALPEEVPAKMDDLLRWYEQEKGDLHSLILAATFHYRFVKIHPFDDGNGRMSRVLMNLILMQGGYPPAIIKMEKRAEYLTALSEADAGDLEKFILFVGESLLESTDLYVRGAKGEHIGEADDLDKKIALLKLQLKNQPDKEIKVKNNREILKKLLEKSINPLAFILINKLVQFNELFLETNHRFHIYKFGIPHNKSIENYPNAIGFYLKTIESNRLLDFLKLEFYWEKIKYNGAQYFDISRTILVVFNTNKYSIKSEPIIKVDKLYSNELSQSEINKIVTTITESILKEIQEKTNTQL